MMSNESHEDGENSGITPCSGSNSNTIVEENSNASTIHYVIVPNQMENGTGFIYLILKEKLKWFMIGF